jgi:type I restriction enzyme S subunit
VTTTELRTVRIGDLGQVITGKTPPSARPELFGEEYPFLTPTDIDGQRRYIAPERFLSVEGRDFQSRLLLPANAICVVCIGATIGKVCITSRPSFTNQQINSIVVNDAEYDPLFIYHLLTTLRDKLRAVAGGAATPIINKSAFCDIKVTVPPLPLQQRIAHVLSSYEHLIENCRRRIPILEEMSRSLYHEWFAQFRFPYHEKISRVDSPLGHIPEGWEVRKLSDLVDTQYGYTESTSVDPIGPKFLRGMDINKTSYIDWADVPYCPISPDDYEIYRLRKGDIVVIRMADPGKVGIVERDVDAVFASYLIRLTPKDDRLLPYFLFYILDSTAYQNFITGASTGTTRKSASAGVITDFELALPPRNLIALFEARAKGFRELLTVLLQKIGNLRRTRDLLLPRLLSGQIPLDAAEVEEAAA